MSRLSTAVVNGYHVGFADGTTWIHKMTLVRELLGSFGKLPLSERQIAGER
jgi:hypothetical protein